MKQSESETNRKLKIIRPAIQLIEERVETDKKGKRGSEPAGRGFSKSHDTPPILSCIVKSTNGQ